MRTIGIFEAKAKLSEICEEVARSGESVVVTRRGKPLVKIDPMVSPSFSIWEEREGYIARTGRLKEEFELPSRNAEFPTSPFDD
jgi:prevent-host-death family protein